MEKLANTALYLGGTLAVGSIFLNSFFYTVEPGHRAIIFDKAFGGVQEKVVGEGMHFYIPGAQKPIIYEVRSIPKTITSVTGTKDLQQVDVALRILYRPIEEYLPSLYNNVGPNFEEKILPSIVNEVLKAEVAKYDGIQLLGQREKISYSIKEEITTRAKGFNLTLDDVALTHLAFGKEFTQAIELKQVAQQDAERQKFIVQKNEEEKKAFIIKYEGESEAARLIADAVKAHGDSYVEVKRIDAAKNIVETLSKSSNVTYVPSTGANLLNLKAF
jgi:prohibitin 1